MNQELSVVKVTFLGVEETEDKSHKRLVFERLWSNGALDTNSKSPFIKSEEFEKYITLHVENLQQTIKDSVKYKETVLKNIEDLITHSRTQVDVLLDFVKQLNQLAENTTSDVVEHSVEDVVEEVEVLEEVN